MRPGAAYVDVALTGWRIKKRRTLKPEAAVTLVAHQATEGLRVMVVSSHRLQPFSLSGSLATHAETDTAVL